MTSTKPATSHSSHNSTLSPLPLRQGAARRDHPGIHARPAEAAEEAAVLDLHAAILDHFEPGGLGDATSRRIFDPKLHPQDPGAHRHRLLGERRDLRAFAETV